MEVIGKSADSYTKSAIEILTVRLLRRTIRASAAPFMDSLYPRWGYQLHVPLRVVWARGLPNRYSRSRSD